MLPHATVVFHMQTFNVLLSIKWVDYVEGPMKYLALGPNFSLWVGEGWWGGWGWGW